MTTELDRVSAVQRRPPPTWLQPAFPSAMVAFLMVVNLAYRWVIAQPGYFWQDDFYITAWAQANPLNTWYLFLPFSDHFQPLGFAAAWVSQRIFPGSYPAAMFWTALVYAGSLWTFYRLLVRLFGWRTQFYLVLLVWGFSIFTVQSYLWYAASLYLAPYLLLVPWAIAAGVRYAQNPRAWRLVSAFVLSALCVAAHTFGTLVPVLTAVLIGTLGIGSPAGTSWWRAIRRQWRLLGAQLLPSVCVAIFYLQRSASGREVTVDPLQSLLFVAKEFLWVIIPAMAGGPWRYNGYLSPEFPLFTPLGGILFVEFVLLLVALCHIKPRAFVFWIFVLLITSAQLLAVTLGRGGGDTSVVIRYAAPALIGLSLALAYSMASGKSELSPWRAQGLVLATGWRRLGLVGRGVVIGVLIQVYLVSFSISVFTPAFETPFALNRAYMTELIGSSKSVSPEVTLLPQFVPNRVVGINAPGPTSTQLVLANLPNSPSFGDSVSGPLWGFTQDGDLVEQVVMGALPEKREDPDCAVRLTEADVVVPLDSSAQYWYATVAVGTLTESGQTIQVELLKEGRPQGVARVNVPAGLQRTYAGLLGEGDSVRLTTTAGSPVCVTDLVVGERFHRSGDEWVQDPSSLPTQSFHLGP